MSTLLRQIALGVAAGLLCGVPAWAAESPSQRYQRLAVSYEQADAAGKQRWLVDLLLHRSDRACRVYLVADDLQRIRARHRAILLRAAAGSELSDSGVQRLLAEVDTEEQHAIDRLQRDYEFATAQAFHDNRDQFERWHNAWHAIESKWLAAGQPFSWQPKIIAWLQQAGERQARLEPPVPSKSTAERAVPRPVSPTIRVIPPPLRASIRHDELEARIAGYNLALSRLISDLHMQHTWTAEELGHAANELAELATVRHDLTLYWELLPLDHRARMPSLEALESAVSLLAARTAQRRRKLEVSAASANSDTAKELRCLDEVSRRLATLAATRS